MADVASRWAAFSGAAAKAVSNTRLVVPRQFVSNRMFSLLQGVARCAQAFLRAGDASRLKSHPHWSFRRCEKGAGSIAVSVGRGADGNRAAVASDQLSRVRHREERLVRRSSQSEGG